MEISIKIQPKLTELSNDISLNPQLFALLRLFAINILSAVDKELLENSYKGFTRSGAALNDTDKELYRQYSTELGALTLKFGQNALAATNAFSINITDKRKVAELPQSVQDAMAADAKAAGKKGWLLTLKATSYIPFLTYSSQRDLKEQLYKAYNSRAYGGEFDMATILEDYG